MGKEIVSLNYSLLSLVRWQINYLSELVLSQRIEQEMRGNKDPFIVSRL